MRLTRRAASARAQTGVVVLAVAVATAGCFGSERDSSSIKEPPPAQASLPAPPVPSGLERFYSQRLSWRGCGGEFQCTELTVPVDYGRPAGPTIRLSVVRLATGDDDTRVGSLIVNPGGPGGSGVQYARAARAVITSAARDAFDVVGFDPRGVGASAPVECLDDQQTDELVAADPTPDTAGEVTATVRLLRQLGERCRQRGGALLPHVDTRSAARDIDVLRAALGDRRLFYLGKSYGTFLGATYADLFPRNVGRMVLDGALDPALSNDEVSIGQGRGFEQATRAFVTDCARQASCPLGSDVTRGMRRLQDLIESMDQSPLRTSDPRRPLTEGLGSLGVAVAMYDEGYWPTLRTALDTALGGDGSALLELSDVYTERGSDGRYRSNQNVAILAVNCLDRPDTGGLRGVERSIARFDRASPTWGRYLAWSQLPCAYWPVKMKTKPARITAEGTPPIVVIGTTRDPATPYQWAQGLADQLSQARLVTYDGDGHTAYMRGSRCVDRAVDAYLLRGTPPEDGLRCDS
ncbi:MAG: alpha/beta hydrolase [Angustibacter sp.]